MRLAGFFLGIFCVLSWGQALALDSPQGLGAVATQHPLATQAATHILLRGGNAVDAAVAAALTLAVVEPHNSGLGAGGMARIWDNQEKKTHAIDFRERAPLKATPQMFSSGQTPWEASQAGPLAIAVPGEVAGLGFLHHHWGKLPWNELFSEAIHWAEQGHIPSLLLQKKIEERSDCLRRDYHTFKIYRPFLAPLHPATPLTLSDAPDPSPEIEMDSPRLVQSQLAETLKTLRDKGPQEFYLGRLAQQLTESLQNKGALLQLEDFQEYQALETPPLSTQFPWGTLWGVPLPSSGGISVIRALNTLEALEKIQGEDWQRWAWFVPLFRGIFTTRNQEMGDPDFLPPLPVQRWISKNFAKEEAKKIAKSLDAQKSLPETNPASEEPLQEPAPGETTHLSIMDGNGNSVSMTLTLNLAFGSCVTAGDTGVLMNNEMDDFNTQTDKPNAFGLIQGKQNNIAPGKRPLSSMSPTLVTQNKEAILAIGSPGGPRIITTIFQVLYGIYFLRQDLQSALSSPRLHYQIYPPTVFLEHSTAQFQRRTLKAEGIPFTPVAPWGNVQAVRYDPTTRRFSAASDPRGEGAAEVLPPKTTPTTKPQETKNE